jgi:hypothetical protein
MGMVSIITAQATLRPFSSYRPRGVSYAWATLAARYGSMFTLLNPPPRPR